MNEEPKSIWKKSWAGPRWLGAWLVLTAATFVIILVITFFLTGGPHGLLEWVPALTALLLMSLVVATVLVCLWIFLRWLFNPRNFKRTLFGLACFVTLIALIYAEEDVRGKWAWNNFKREWEAKGEKFDLASFIPPTVPDDQNFAMTPLLRPILDYSHSTNGVRWRDTNGYARLERLSIYAADVKYDGALDFGTADRAANLGVWGEYYRSSTNFPVAEKSASAAQSVLTALGKFDAEMNELREAAAARTLSRFPIHYEEIPPMDILLPHLARMKGLCLLFELHAIALMELGRGEESLIDLQTSFRLSDSIRNEPFLIDHLVRLGTLGINLNGLHEGLVRHVWDDAQLARLEKYLASLDILAEYKTNMRGDRSFGLSGLEYYRRMGFRAQFSDLNGTGQDGEGKISTAWINNVSFLPGGFYYQNMVAMARLHQEFALAAVDEEKHRAFPEISNEMKDTIVAMRTTPYNIFAKMLMPALARTSRKSARIQVSVDEAHVACALERYRLAHGQFPEALAALVPQFLEKIPTDVIGGQPLNYRRTDGGKFLLYSIGWNEKDDGGVAALYENKKDDLENGDWVWPTK